MNESGNWNQTCRSIGKINWKIQLWYVKAHVRIQGNEVADTLGKEAATKADIIECYKRVSKCVVISELGDISVKQWQRKWDQITKGKTTKECFTIVADKLHMKINITHNFTSIVMGHGNIRSYLLRFKILETPTCPCSTEDHFYMNVSC
jgi:hypothetical protein